MEEKLNRVSRDNSVEERSSELVSVMSKLHNSVSTAEEVFIGLCEKLHPVLRPDAKVGGGKEPVNPEFYTPLAQGINEAVTKLNDLIDAIQRTRGRLEL